MYQMGETVATLARGCMGKVVALDCVDYSVSHPMYQNAAIGEDILTFTVKEWLQVLPTEHTLAHWYR